MIVNIFKKTISLIVFLICILPPIAIFACIWDYDTIKMERARFPSALELITGKFLRHSTEFYQWRISDRLKKLEKDPTNVTLLDDLAVAYDKTGQHDKAIETTQNTEKIKPGRYETSANLGTFYFHAGKLEEGLPYIKKALTINPDAHFGREFYQLALVEYLLHQRKNDPLKLPLADVTYPENSKSGSEIYINNTFENFLKKRLHPKKIKQGEKESEMGQEGLPVEDIRFSESLTTEETNKAIKGILGMMRFGSYNSPILLEALGSILSPPSFTNMHDAKLLACRAYLKASYEIPDGPARIAYQKMALAALAMQWGSEQLENIEPLFKKELEEAQIWYAKLRENELSWIREGKNPEVEFDKLYDADPELSGGNNFFDKALLTFKALFNLNESQKRKLIPACLVTMLILLILFRRNRLRRKK